MRSIVWRFLLVTLVVAWAISEVYPWKQRNMVDVMREQAVDRMDDTLDEVLEEAKAAKPQDADLTWGKWQEILGDTDLREYYPDLAAKLPKKLAGKEITTKEANRRIVDAIQKEAFGEIRYGLDLRGGTEFKVRLDSNETGARLESLVNHTIEVFRKRLDPIGVSEPVIQSAGDDFIVIQMPGLSEQDRDNAERIIQTTAKLELCRVHPESKDLVDSGRFVPGYREMTMERTEGTNRWTETLMVAHQPAVTGDKITDASFGADQGLGLSYNIYFNLDKEGGNMLGHFTRQNIGNRMAIILDGEMKSAPVIRGEIRTSGMIEGSFTRQEAEALANTLSNPLRAKVKIEEKREVDPSLGRDSVRKGQKAATYGLIAVAVFMLAYYMLAGFLANLALALNIVILLGVLCSYDATLTLPGIAGIVLTIGMAVDANVLIFERIREEMRAGKSLRGAISAGYGKAFGTIFDANITTLIASTILMAMGTGPVQGFGVTLTIGICTSMFTALVVTRVVFDLLLEWGLIKQVKMLSVVQNTKIDFLKWSTPAFVVSWLLIGAGIVTTQMRGKEAILGVDFAGGHSLVLNYENSQNTKLKTALDEGTLRSTLANGIAGIGPDQIQLQTQLDRGDGTQRLRVDFPNDAAGRNPDLVMAALEQSALKDYGFVRASLDTVGPSVSGEIQKSAIKAVLLALFFILVYVAFRYEFFFAIGAVLAILHDVLMTAGWFFLVGGELNAPIVAALLTILGFSINDTIVIFDRIREGLRTGVRGSFTEVMNVALNQTLSRTIITSGTTLLAVGMLYVLGGTVINPFAFTLLVGVIAGTYSSIYIACAFVNWMYRGKRPDISVPVIEPDPVSA